MSDTTIVSEGNIFIVANEGIYLKLPQHEYLYQLLMPKEVFIEAYNRYIRDDTSSNSNKEFIG